MIATLLAPQPPGTRILYQKQMSHHLLPDIGREWLAQMRHAFLIRDPLRDWYVLTNLVVGATLVLAYLAFGFEDFRGLLGRRSTRYADC